MSSTASLLPFQPYEILSYLLSEGLDTIGRYSLLPWTIVLLRNSLSDHNDLSLHSLTTHNAHILSRASLSSSITSTVSSSTSLLSNENSWARVVSAYGLLHSALILGRVTSKMISSNFDTTAHDILNADSNTHTWVGILACCYIALTMTTRFSFLLFIYFVIGLTGSRLSETTIAKRFNNNNSLSSIESHNPTTNPNLSSNSALTSSSSSSPSSSSPSPSSNLIIQSNESTKRKILAFIFVTLISGALYDELELSQFPAKFPCLVMFLLCTFVWALSVLKYLRKQYNNKKSSSSSLSSSSSSSAYFSVFSITKTIFSFLISIIFGLLSIFSTIVGTIIGFIVEKVYGNGNNNNNNNSNSNNNGNGSNKGNSAGGIGNIGSLSPPYQQKNPRFSSSSSSSSSSATPSSVGKSKRKDLESGSSSSSSSKNYANEEIPKEFISVFGTQAATAFRKTMQWREQNQVDSMLTEPHPLAYSHFHEILEMYPHAIHGFSKDHCAVVYEVLGKSRPKDLSSAGITPEMMVWHFILRNELIFKIMDDDEKLSNVSSSSSSSSSSVHQVMTVLDVKGIRVVDITADVISFIKQSAEIMDTHYPGRVARLVICNAPSWFYSVWSMVARVLPESVRKKIIIIHDTAGLSEFIDPSQRPVDYSGTDVALGNSREHKAFLRLFEIYENSLANTPSISNLPSPSTDDEDAESTSSSSSSSNRLVVTTEGDDGGEGMFGWMRSRFRQTTAPVAYLGEKNSFRYDAATRSWVSDGQESNDDINESTSKELTSDQIEEHGLVLAIQAAHLASLNSKDGRNGHDFDTKAETGNNISQEDNISAFGISLLGRNYPSGGSGDNGSNSNSSSNTHNNGNNNNSGVVGSMIGSCVDERATKMSAQVFLLVMSMYTAACLVQGGLMTLLPAWLASDITHGGLGYGVGDMALTFSCTGVVLLFFVIYFRARVLLILRLSPVRALRIACGALVVVGFLIPLILLPHPLVIAESINTTSSSSSYSRPTTNLFCLFWPSLLFATLFGAAHIGRKAAGILLQIALNPSFSSPNTVINAVGSLVDVISPTVMTLIYSSIYRNCLRFPLDATCFLSLSTCVSALLYLGSLLINIHFRGDFGIMSDQSVEEGTISRYNHMTTAAAHSSPQRHQYHHHPGSSSSSGLGLVSTMLWDVAKVPSQDLTLLLGNSLPDGGSTRAIGGIGGADYFKDV